MGFSLDIFKHGDSLTIVYFQCRLQKAPYKWNQMDICLFHIANGVACRHLRSLGRANK